MDRIDRIEQQRQAIGMSLEDLSLRSGLAYNTVRDALRHISNPTQDTLDRMEIILGIDVTFPEDTPANVHIQETAARTKSQEASLFDIARQVSANYAKALDNYLKALHPALTYKQYLILNYVQAHPEGQITLTRISDELGLTYAIVRKAVESLQEETYIHRYNRGFNTHSKGYYYQLTPKGKRVHQAIQRDLTEYHQLLQKATGLAELDTITPNLIERIVPTMDRFIANRKSKP
ncbi:hypothetical protein CL176_00970 [Suicoccus acidiformans]|uniref:HTH cro/C1-type domain-containing protein n=1 Tax=Suicoccus acidiformans TaxID=2036206 RepID=A0A347WI06_9LACT|nr:helix-turn-helix domain-containing protein [Suicoccus acidiformans]AXY24713.1 hypothetical protein CL176_00970 [Suicoccus acidiformans]